MASATAGSFLHLKRVDVLPSGLRNGAGLAAPVDGFTGQRLRSSSATSTSRPQRARGCRASVVEADEVNSTSPLFMPRMKYSESVYKTVRRKTRTVMVGDVAVGSDFPIRVQTMTTSDTKNVKATVDEVIRIADKGAEICRITVQGKKEADACEEIKNKLVQLGYNIPLVADIHFAPTIALKVADCFDKIRINPGNFADTRAVFKTVEYTEESYQRELEHIEEVFSKLVIKCKQLGRAMRIGTNHGSLSDRIMSYYGDSPRGMVESALEFARICRKYDYHNFVFSMKASNPVVMVAAYRLLCAELINQGPDWNYPLHLGVTEAGEGEDGRMKSAIGIGALLQDGLGDTIRVSLTEAPEEEIDPCSKLANYGMKASAIQRGVEPFEEKHRRYFDFARRSGQLPLQREGDSIDFRGILHRDGSVLLSVSPQDLEQAQNPEKLYRALACKLVVGMPFKDLATADTLLLREVPAEGNKEARLALKRLQEVGVGVMAPLEQLQQSPLPNAIALLTLDQAIAGAHKGLSPNTRVAVSVRGDEPLEKLQALKACDPVMLLANVPYEEEQVGRVQASRRLFEFLESKEISTPVIHHLIFPAGIAKDDMVLQAGCEAGALLVDGLGDGVLLEAPGQDLDFLRTTSFGMLQGCRMRNTKTEFVSCPSCGRTLFDLQEVTASIRERTSHLPGVAIAIMGCIVNGPGEMADADFGYVGGAPGKIDLYVGKEVVQRAIPMEEATDALIELIKSHGRWVEPEKEEEPVAA